MPEGGEETRPTTTITINKVMKAEVQLEAEAAHVSGMPLGPVWGPCQLQLAQGAFSEWERPQNDLAGLWERSQPSGRGPIPRRYVPTAAGTGLSLSTQRLLGGSGPDGPCALPL